MQKLSFIPVCILAILLMGASGPISPKNNAIWHNSKGLEYMNQDRVCEAVCEYKIAIALNPDSSASAAFYNNLGIAYMRMKQPKWAITCFKNAIDLNAASFCFYENLVNAYDKAGVLNQEYAYYKKQSIANYENSFNWIMLGLIQKQKHDYKNAIKSFNTYIMLEPELVVSRAVKEKVDDIRHRDI